MTLEDPPPGEDLPGDGGGDNGDPASESQPKPEGLNCKDFVNWLVNKYFDSFTRETFAILTAKVGFEIAHNRSLPDAHGFKKALIAHGQDGDIYAHILVMAAFEVGQAGKAALINLPAKLASEGMILKDLYDGLNSEQGKVELVNDLVGKAAGRILALSAPEWQKMPLSGWRRTNSRADAKRKIEKLLCD
jgi:hypothetical protein